MNKNNYILVYDSGIGGLTTLASIMIKNKNQNYIYYADTKNCPYGSKCNTELQNIIINNIKNLIGKYNISYIILACNTATTVAISKLRTLFNIPIIGTEPNIKTPFKQGYANITVLATPATLKQDKLLNLENSIPIKKENIGIKNLAIMIEKYKLNKDKTLETLIHKKIDKVLEKTPKTNAIVLGCTHYIYLREYISNKGYTCFDGNTGVANRLNQLLLKDNQPSNDKNNKLIIITGDSKTKLKYKKILYAYKNKLEKL